MFSLQIWFLSGKTKKKCKFNWCIQQITDYLCEPKPFIWNIGFALRFWRPIILFEQSYPKSTQM